MLFLLTLLACKGGADDLTSTGSDPTSPSETGTPTGGASGDTGAPDTVCAPTENALRFTCTGTGTLRWWPEDRPERVREADIDGDYVIWGLRADVATVVELPDGTVGRVLPGRLPVQVDLARFATTGTGSSAIAVPNPCDGRDLLVVDDEGALVGYESFEGPISAIDITPDGTFLVLIAANRLLEFDRQGQLLMNVDGAPFPLHHDVARDAQGLTYVLYAYDHVEDGVNYVLDGLYVVDRDGNLIADWRLDAHLPPGTLYPDERGFYWEGRFPGAVDFSHANSVEITDDGAVMLSFRWLHAVLRLSGDPAAPGFGEVEWVLAPEYSDLASDFSLLGDDPDFYGQHHATLDTDGRLWLFDNRAEGAARAVRYTLDGSDATLDRAWTHDRNCPVQGAAYPTDDDGVLLSCSTHGQIREFGPTDTLPRYALDLSCGDGSGNYLLNRGVPVPW